MRLTIFRERWGWIIGCAVIGALAGRLYYANLDAPLTLPERNAPTPNAYDTYVQAFEKLPQKINPVSVRDLKKLTLAERQAALKADAEGLRLVRLALQQKYLAPLPRFNENNRPMAQFRVVARLLAAEGEVRRERGDASGATQSFLDAIALGQKLPAGGALIDRMVGVACQAIGRQMIWSEKTGDAAALKKAAKRMETILAADVPLSETFVGEKRATQIEIGRMLKDPDQVWALTHPNDVSSSEEEGQKQPNAPSAWKKRVNQQMFLFVWPRRSALTGYNAYMDAAIELLRKPHALRAAQLKRPTDMFSALLIPVIEQTAFRDDINRTQNALLTVSLALWAYHAEKGAYPENLDALVAGGYLTRIPADPFSADGIAPLRYHRRADDAFAYSIGPDGKDNGGEAIVNSLDQNGSALPPDSRQQYEVRPGSLGDIIAGLNR